MSVTREVILDLLPLYLAGEASPASRALVEEYLRQDPELAERIRILGTEGFAPSAPADLPPDLELKSLRRTRRLLGVQRWLFGLGIAFVVLPMSMRFDLEGWRVTRFRFLVSDYPQLLGPMLALGIACWIAYGWLKYRLGDKTSKLRRRRPHP
jgi:anti-sigma factor RsiW